MEIKQINREAKGFFKAIISEKETGRMTYSWAGKDKFIIDHTAVDPDFKGQQVGRHLVMAAVAFAREQGVKIIPLCPFAKRIFDTTAEIKDVL